MRFTSLTIIAAAFLVAASHAAPALPPPPPGIHTPEPEKIDKREPQIPSKLQASKRQEGDITESENKNPVVKLPDLAEPEDKSTLKVTKRQDDDEGYSILRKKRQEGDFTASGGKKPVVKVPDLAEPEDKSTVKVDKREPQAPHKRTEYVDDPMKREIVKRFGLATKSEDQEAARAAPPP